MLTYVNHQTQAAEKDGSYQQVPRLLYNLTRYAARSEDVVCPDSSPGTIQSSWNAKLQDPTRFSR
jgi:hypothetical protein